MLEWAPVAECWPILGRPAPASRLRSRCVANPGCACTLASVAQAVVWFPGLALAGVVARPSCGMPSVGPVSEAWLVAVAGPSSLASGVVSAVGGSCICSPLPALVRLPTGILHLRSHRHRHLHHIDIRCHLLPFGVWCHSLVSQWGCVTVAVSQNSAPLTPYGCVWRTPRHGEGCFRKSGSRCRPLYSNSRTHGPHRLPGLVRVAPEGFLHLHATWGWGSITRCPRVWLYSSWHWRLGRGDSTRWAARLDAHNWLITEKSRILRLCRR